MIRIGAVLLSLGLATAHAQPVVVDDFSDVQIVDGTAGDQSGRVSISDVPGGTRHLRALGALASVDGIGSFSCESGPGLFPQCTVTYDASTGASVNTASGLIGDITRGGASDRVEFDVAVSQGVDCTVGVTLVRGTSSWTSFLAFTSSGLFSLPLSALIAQTGPGGPVTSDDLENATGFVIPVIVDGVGTCTLSPRAFVVGGELTGLDGGDTVVLQNNMASDLSLVTDGTFQFPQSQADGAAYAISVSQQPAGKTCEVSNSVGSVAGSNVSDIEVQCVSSDDDPEVDVRLMEFGVARDGN